MLAAVKGIKTGSVLTVFIIPLQRLSLLYSHKIVRNIPILFNKFVYCIATLKLALNIFIGMLCTKPHLLSLGEFLSPTLIGFCLHNQSHV